jgi:hypothetical protein
MMTKKDLHLSVIQKWSNMKNVYYVSDKNYTHFKMSNNIKTQIFDRTAQHTHLLNPVARREDVPNLAPSVKMYDLYSTPFSTQDPLKPLLNSKPLLQTLPQPKITMTVNQQFYTDISEEKLLDYYSSLRSDPLNQNLNPARSVKFIKSEIINDMTNILDKEKVNNIDYTTYEQSEIEKAHYYMSIFKSSF